MHLQIAAELFDPEGLPVEHAKSLMALGAARRATGDTERAIASFERACEIFHARSLTAEAGAALYNLGLVRRDAGDREGAVEALEQATVLLAEASRKAELAMAERELGVIALIDGRAEAAVERLSKARDLADEARDADNASASANALGLAALALGRPGEAAAAFRESIAWSPRSLRAEAHAMAKANLALAEEQLGRLHRARLAAAQALAVPGAPAAVKQQAAHTLDRLGMPHDDLLAVLGEEPPAAWDALMREELLRWLALAPGERKGQAATWVALQVGHPQAAELAEAFVRTLLEFPPEQLEILVTALLAAAGDAPDTVAERWRSQMQSALVRFPVPQWTRFRAVLNDTARKLGQEPAWT